MQGRRDAPVIGHGRGESLCRTRREVSGPRPIFNSLTALSCRRTFADSVVKQVPRRRTRAVPQ